MPNIKIKDQMDFEQVIEPYYQPIERFLFQYGVKVAQVEEIMKAIIGEAFQTIETIESDRQIRDWLFQIAIQTLQNNTELKIYSDDEQQNITEPNGKQLFHFEEDQEFHFAIAMLPDPLKVPFILFYIHDFEVKDIAEMLNTSIYQVEDRLVETKQQLITNLNSMNSEPNFLYEKRIGLLRKAYSRVPNLSKMETVLETIKAERIAESSSINKGKNKFGIWKPVIISFLIVGVFASIFFVSERSFGEVNQRFIENLSERFEEDLKEKQEMLGINDEIFESLEFVRVTRIDFDSYVNGLRMNGIIEKKNEVNEWYDKFQEGFQLPSEMVEKLSKQPLTDDLQDSTKFLESYMNRLGETNYAYNETFYRLSIVNDYKTSELSLEEYFEQLNNEDIDSALKAMNQQNIKLKYNEPHETFYADFYDEETINILRTSLHESIGDYTILVESHPFFTSSIDESVPLLKKYEKVFLNNDYSIFDDYLKSRMINVLFSIIATPDFDGTLNEEHRQAWLELSKIEGNSPIAKIMMKMVNEMEAAEWKITDIESRLDIMNIFKAFEMAKAGRLDEFEIIILTEAITEIEEPAFYDEAFLLPDRIFSHSVQLLYEKYSLEYDREILKDVSPLMIVGLYFHANELDNPYMMWHLLNKDSLNTSIEEYVQNWVQEPDQLKDLIEIRFDSSLVSINNNKTPIFFNKDGNEKIVWMVLAEDEVWEIDSTIHQ